MASGFRAIFLLCIGLLLSGSVSANVIEAIDINRVDDNAQIVIRFGSEIQYLRHGPENEAKFLRVFFRVVKPGFLESEIMQETLRSPPSDLVPRFKVSYPELINGMLISFDKPVRYTLVPGGDARSIVITVPLPDGKRKSQVTPPPAPLAAAAVPPAAEATATVTPTPAPVKPPVAKGKSKAQAVPEKKIAVEALPAKPAPDRKSVV